MASDDAFPFWEQDALKPTSTKRLRLIIIRLALVYCCNSPTGNELLNSVEQGKSYRLEVDVRAEVFIRGFHFGNVLIGLVQVRVLDLKSYLKYVNIISIERRTQCR